MVRRHSWSSRATTKESSSRGGGGLQSLACQGETYGDVTRARSSIFARESLVAASTSL